jgi:hypothetical protein
MPSAANSARPGDRVLTILPFARRNYQNVPITLKSTLGGCRLNLCYLSLLVNLLSFFLIYTVANRQGDNRGELKTMLTK